MAGAIVSTSMLSLRLQTVGAIKSAIWLSFAETVMTVNDIFCFYYRLLCRF